MFEATNEKGKLVLAALVEAGWAKEVVAAASIEYPARAVTSTSCSTEIFSVHTPTNTYKNNHLPLESNLEKIAKDFFGICEPYKDWKKLLKEGVDQYGHDTILDSFYEWAEAQSGSYMGRKPMDAFFKNLGQRIVSSKPQVTNPLLDKMEKGVAILTDSRVYFVGEFRVRLAALLREHGLNLVSQAFAEFWGLGIEEKSITWAARDFLQQAPLRIHTFKAKEQAALEQAKAVAEAVELAKQQAGEPEEEDEQEL